MIIGDVEGGDKHCATKVFYTINQPRLCQQCNVSDIEAGNPKIQCKKMVQEKVKNLVKNNERKKLRSISQHNVYSAWFDVDFGGCQYGAFSAVMPNRSITFLGGWIDERLFEYFV